MIPLYRKSRDRAQQVGLRPVARQMLDRLVDEEADILRALARFVVERES